MLTCYNMYFQFVYTWPKQRRNRPRSTTSSPPSCPEWSELLQWPRHRLYSQSLSPRHNLWWGELDCRSDALLLLWPRRPQSGASGQSVGKIKTIMVCCLPLFLFLRLQVVDLLFDRACCQASFSSLKKTVRCSSSFSFLAFIIPLSSSTTLTQTIILYSSNAET